MLIDRSIFFILYDSIYYFTAALVVLSYLSIEFNNDVIRQRSVGKILVFIPLISIIILVGLRDYNVGSDTYNYYNIVWLTEEKISFDTEFLLLFLSKIIKYLGLNYSYFLFVTATIFFSVIYVSIKKISNFYNSNILYSFFAYFSMFFFLNMSINIIRQGISLSLLLLAYSYLINKSNKIKIAIVATIAAFFHITALIPILVYFFSYKNYKLFKDRYYYLLYMIFIVLSYLNIGLLDISPYILEVLGSDNRRSDYLSDNDFEYVVGFKTQFVAFNTLFLLVASYVKSRILSPSIRSTYSVLFRYYVLTSCIFFTAFQIPFSDRWGLFSWIAIPILLVPLFSITYIKKGIKIHWIILLILIFIGFNIYA
jgi:hypothetical protein